MWWRLQDRLAPGPLGVEFLLGRLAMLATLGIFVVREAPGFRFLDLGTQLILLVSSSVFAGVWVWFWLTVVGRRDDWRPAAATALMLVSATVIVWQRPIALFPFYFVVVLAGAAYRWKVGVWLAGVATAWSLAVWWLADLASPWTLQGVVVLVLLAGGSVVLRRYVEVQLELLAARDRVRQLAAAEERARVARDMHDQLGQDLTVAVLHSELLSSDLKRHGDTGAADRADVIVTSTRDALRVMRDMVTSLRAPQFATEVDRASTVLGQSGLRVTTDVAEADDLPAQVDEVLGWVVRESATNTLRHSDADQCTISLTRDATDMVLRVEDNGNPPQVTGQGTGLAGLTERVTDLSGSLRCGSEDSGFVVEARVPLSEFEVDLR